MIDVFDQQSQIIRFGLESLASAASAIDNLLGVFDCDSFDFSSNPVLINQDGIAANIERICTSQANAYSCLFDNSSRNSETARQTKLRACYELMGVRRVEVDADRSPRLSVRCVR